MYLAHRNTQWRCQLPIVFSIELMLLVVGAEASEADDGLGKADAQPNRITGQVVLAEGQPASHATIHVRMPERDGIEATITTDADGHFDFVVRMQPEEFFQLQVTATSQDEQQLDFQMEVITFWSQAEGFDHIQINYDPISDKELAVTHNRLVPIRGQVIGEDGRPAANIQIRVNGQGAGLSFFDFGKTYRTDAEGHYEIAVAPNLAYLLTVLDDHWVAGPQSGFAVLPGIPLDNRNFQLRTPTRVHGRLLNEQTQEPIPSEYVKVYQRGIALQDIPEAELPNLVNKQHWVEPMEQYYATTDELGQFEFLLGDGEFDLRPPQRGKAEKFTITGQPDIEMDLTTKIQPEVELLGIVIDRETSQPIADVMVSGAPRSYSGGDWQAKTGEDGKFKVRRREEVTYALAVSADRSQTAIVEIGDTKKTFVIQLEPVGMARGRLLNDAKEPESLVKTHSATRLNRPILRPRAMAAGECFSLAARTPLGCTIFTACFENAPQNPLTTELNKC